MAEIASVVRQHSRVSRQGRKPPQLLPSQSLRRGDRRRNGRSPYGDRSPGFEPPSPRSNQSYRSGYSPRTDGHPRNAEYRDGLQRRESADRQDWTSADESEGASAESKVWRWLGGSGATDDGTQGAGAAEAERPFWYRLLGWERRATPAAAPAAAVAKGNGGEESGSCGEELDSRGNGGGGAEGVMAPALLSMSRWLPHGTGRESNIELEPITEQWTEECNGQRSMRWGTESRVDSGTHTPGSQSHHGSAFDAAAFEARLMNEPLIADPTVAAATAAATEPPPGLPSWLREVDVGSASTGLTPHVRFDDSGSNPSQDMDGPEPVHEARAEPPPRLDQRTKLTLALDAAGEHDEDGMGADDVDRDKPIGFLDIKDELRASRVEAAFAAADRNEERRGRGVFRASESSGSSVGGGRGKEWERRGADGEEEDEDASEQFLLDKEVVQAMYDSVTHMQWLTENFKNLLAFSLYTCLYLTVLYLQADSSRNYEVATSHNILLPPGVSGAVTNTLSGPEDFYTWLNDTILQVLPSRCSFRCSRPGAPSGAPSGAPVQVLLQVLPSSCSFSRLKGHHVPDPLLLPSFLHRSLRCATTQHVLTPNALCPLATACPTPQVVWKDPPCGNRVCERPLEFPAFGRFGCEADCGVLPALRPLTLRLSSAFASLEYAQASSWNLCPQGLPSLCWSVPRAFPSPYPLPQAPNLSPAPHPLYALSAPSPHPLLLEPLPPGPALPVLVSATGLPPFRTLSLPIVLVSPIGLPHPPPLPHVQFMRHYSVNSPPHATAPNSPSFPSQTLHTPFPSMPQVRGSSGVFPGGGGVGGDSVGTGG
ncbi:unnamed protein product [Closterium sp. NIES-54]